MSTTTSGSAPPRGTRPRNRRDLIVAAAAGLFAHAGYSRVGMSDIAEAVAISRPALYRHFTNKQELLTEVVAQAIERSSDALRGADLDDLDSVLRAIARAVLDYRGAGVLWQRDGRHLPAEQRELLRAKTQDMGLTITRLVRERRPELSEQQAALLTWCALAVATSVSFHDLELPRADYEGLLAEMVGRVIAATLPEGSAGGHRDHRAPVLVSQSRWEELLTTATRMFAEQGYAGVGMDDIAAAVGIAGPSVYNHFDSKSEILSAAMTRGAEWMRYDMQSALKSASSPADGLHRLLRAYTAFVLEHNDLVDLLINEAGELPEQTRRQIRRVARDYIGDWTHLLRTVHPDLDQTHASIRVQAVLSMANNIARSPRLRELPGVAELLVHIGAAILELPAPVRS